MADPGAWPSVNYEDWNSTCDTLHGHVQVLGKLAAELAPPEPEFQHFALSLTARGWETNPLPAPDGSGAFVAVLNLLSHEAVIEHVDGRSASVSLRPNRSVGEVTRELLSQVTAQFGECPFDPTPAEVPWTVPLDEDEEHATYEEDLVAHYHVAASRAALVLAAFRASYRGRSTPVNAWWGSFDLAVNLIPDSQEFAIGWWPGDPRYPRAAFYAYARPAPNGLAEGDLGVPGSAWNEDLAEFILEWGDVIGTEDPHGRALDFARSAYEHAARVCKWDPALTASLVEE